MKLTTHLSRFPSNYKKLDGSEWQIFPGKLAGSAQPGAYSRSINDLTILADLKAGKTTEQVGIDKELIDNLNALYQDNITTIYSLVGDHGFRNTELLKYIWENMHQNTSYLTEINGLNIYVEDGAAPTPTQLHSICDDAINRIESGEHILVHCRAGAGRTGVVLAAIYMKAHKQYNAEEAIQYIRDNYLDYAVETSMQEESLRRFGEQLQQTSSITHAEHYATAAVSNEEVVEEVATPELKRRSLLESIEARRKRASNSNEIC